MAEGVFFVPLRLGELEFRCGFIFHVELAWLGFISEWMFGVPWVSQLPPFGTGTPTEKCFIGLTLAGCQ